MIRTRQYCQNRTIDFGRWASKQDVPGLDAEIIADIFEYVLSSQDADGSIYKEETQWKVVQTAVTLKALAKLSFPADARCVFHDARNTRHEARVQLGLEYLRGKLAPLSQGQFVGEDIWDTCQVLLALAAFDRTAEGQIHADAINTRWQSQFQTVLTGDPLSRWAGPAFLAAMLEVVDLYGSQLTQQSQSDRILDFLKSLEEHVDKGPTGRFPSKIGDPNTTRWNTALVLRTIASLPHHRPDEHSLIARSVAWLLGELERNDDWANDPSMEAMFRARCMEGLIVARSLIEPGLQVRVDKALRAGNVRLNHLWKQKTIQVKACTAVCEYFAAITWPIRVGLALDVARGLRPEDDHPDGIDFQPGGLRLAWLSDLHVARPEDHAKKGLTPSCMRLVAGLMHFKGSPLTQHFPEQNLKRILTEVVRLKPDHVLVSGDITNFATGEQFTQAKNTFLSAQSELRGGTPGNLDPSLWTILPGNHDVTTEEAIGGGLRKNLGRFFAYFAETYTGCRDDYDDTYPFVRRLGGRNGGLALRLVCLDSNVSSPVWRVGVNARGRIDPAQMNKLTEIVANPSEGEMTLVVLHHHPIVIPDLVSPTEDFFLSLDEIAGRKLVAICSNSQVAAILHGHFHKFSMWSGLRPNGRTRLQIIGSPAGTMNVPDGGLEFLELREACLRSRPGLALFSHRLENDKWIESYRTFID